MTVLRDSDLLLLLLLLLLAAACEFSVNGRARFRQGLWFQVRRSKL
jgi:hypothetical protein